MTRKTRWILGVIVGAVVSVQSIHAETVLYRMDAEVWPTGGIAGVLGGTAGALFVEYDDALPDQHTSGPNHTYFGEYGVPGAAPIYLLWDFGGGDVVQTEQGVIKIVNGKYPSSDDWYKVLTTGVVSPVGITKGAFENLNFQGTTTSLRDYTGYPRDMLTSDALVLPDLSKANSAMGTIGFNLNTVLFSYKVTGFALLDHTVNSVAEFIAGSPATLSQGDIVKSCG